MTALEVVSLNELNPTNIRNGFDVQVVCEQDPSWDVDDVCRVLP